MTPLAFLRREEVQALITRAAAGAGVPVSVHVVERNREGIRVFGVGQCHACAHVAGLGGGNLACRLSRSTAAGMALGQGRPMPFVCHLGLACVSVPLPMADNLVLTMGPYCPMEEQRSLEADVRAGLEAIGEEGAAEELPFTLADIHRAPAASVPALAEWLLESLRAEWVRQTSVEPEEVALPGAVEAEEVRETPGPRPARTSVVGGEAQALAAALAGRDSDGIRRIVRGTLVSVGGRGASGLAKQRARVLALAGETVEALARSGLSVEPAWAVFPDFSQAVAVAESEGALIAAIRDLFRFLRRGPAREELAERLPGYVELVEAINRRLPGPVRLEEVAAELGQGPTAITHRLQRKLGLSFSELVGRMRVERAKALFRETRLGTTAVANRIGIPDASNFARLFKRWEGMTPAAYRKQFGKKS